MLPRVKPGLVAVAVVALALIVSLGWFVSVGNDLVAREQTVRESWAQVQNVYQRRADLIPNLVETVKGFAAQERTVLEEVTRARASVAGMQVTPEILRDPEALRKFQAAQAELGGALGRLLAVVERYPDLKSNQNFLALQSQLEGTENRIVVERRRYNEAVRDYNTAIRRFPRSLVASLRGFSERSFFEATPGSEAAPAIKL
ncbi:MAG TPA: LemA family protein [Methylomirabilota bacterium]